ncbi:MAG TPA: TetR/AcrR family transcriptional regulator [Thermomicrobiales bacterium]|nr:TetR/AcrR family transcriptional regulator [Thermomicrobiales bacterium]
MAPRPDVSAERRDQILDAASTVFARLGLHRARMDDIAAESRLSKGALYLYFKSKDDLIAAILRRIYDHELRAVRAAQTDTGPASQRLLALADHMTAQVRSLAILLPIWFEFYALAGRQRAVRQALVGYFHEYRDLLAALIERGCAQGEFRPVDPAQTATTFIALLEGVTLLWAVEPEAFDVAEQARSAVRLLLAGLAAGDSGPPPG